MGINNGTIVIVDIYLLIGKVIGKGHFWERDGGHSCTFGRGMGVIRNMHNETHSCTQHVKSCMRGIAMPILSAHLDQLANVFEMCSRLNFILTVSQWKRRLARYMLQTDCECTYLRINVYFVWVHWSLHLHRAMAKLCNVGQFLKSLQSLLSASKDWIHNFIWYVSRNGGVFLCCHGTYGMTTQKVSSVGKSFFRTWDHIKVNMF